jgi:hypothetical protein
LKKDDIVKNIQTHFPDKTPHEINDVVVLANAAAGRSQPRDKDNTRAAKNKMLKTQKDFSIKLEKMKKK